ncbi:O-acetyl-ADP-ribose deacetylase [Bacteroidota bacterium]
MNPRIKIQKGDITKLKVEAIVNAANKTLLGGGGVDGAIHRAAGTELLEACKILNGCETGQAKITRGFLLPSKYVIHTVGPVWRGGQNKEKELLSSCYINSLELAKMNNCSSIAFPNISTGIYGYPKVEAATIAVETVEEFLTSNEIPKEVIFICFDDENFKLYSDLTG